MGQVVLTHFSATSAGTTTVGDTGSTGAVTVSTPSQSVPTITTSTGSPSIPPSGCVLVKTLQTQGLSLQIYFQEGARAAENQCIYTALQNIRSPAWGWPLNENITVANSAGATVYQARFAYLGVVSATFSEGHYWANTAYWNSSTASTGATPQAGTYQLSVAIKMPTAADIMSDVNITLSS